MRHILNNATGGAIVCNRFYAHISHERHFSVIKVYFWFVFQRLTANISLEH